MNLIARSKEEKHKFLLIQAVLIIMENSQSLDKFSNKLKREILKWTVFGKTVLIKNHGQQKYKEKVALMQEDHLEKVFQIFVRKCNLPVYHYLSRLLITETIMEKIEIVLFQILNLIVLHILKC